MEENNDNIGKEITTLKNIPNDKLLNQVTLRDLILFKEDILKEWEKKKKKKIDEEEFLGKYNFDYLIVDKYHEERLYEMQNENYEIIYDNGEEEMRVFKKV